MFNLYKNKELIATNCAIEDARIIALTDLRGANHIYHHYGNEEDFVKHSIVALSLNKSDFSKVDIYEITQFEGEK